MSYKLTRAQHHTTERSQLSNDANDATASPVRDQVGNSRSANNKRARPASTVPNTTCPLCIQCYSTVPFQNVDRELSDVPKKFQKLADGRRQGVYPCEGLCHQVLGARLLDERGRRGGVDYSIFETQPSLEETEDREDDFINYFKSLCVDIRKGLPKSTSLANGSPSAGSSPHCKRSSDASSQSSNYANAGSAPVSPLRISIPPILMDVKTSPPPASPSSLTPWPALSTPDGPGRASQLSVKDVRQANPNVPKRDHAHIRPGPGIHIRHSMFSKVPQRHSQSAVVPATPPSSPQTSCPSPTSRVNENHNKVQTTLGSLHHANIKSRISRWSTFNSFGSSVKKDRLELRAHFTATFQRFCCVHPSATSPVSISYPIKSAGGVRAPWWFEDESGGVVGIEDGFNPALGGCRNLGPKSTASTTS